MKGLQLFIIPLLLLIGCQKNQLPEGILDEQRMVNVLADLSVIDGYMSSLMYTDTLRIEGRSYYATIYKNHNISKDVFDKSLKFYSNQPVLLDSMYSKVTRKLEAKERFLNKVQSGGQLKKAPSK